MTTSTVDKLNYLNDTKNAIKAAIRSKGQAVSDSDSFRSYATKIINIPSGDVITAINNTGAAINAGDKVWITPNGNTYDIVRPTKLQHNFTVVGNPTIDEITGIVSNMDANNYINPRKYMNDTYVEIYIKFMITSPITADNNLIKNDINGSAIYIDGGTKTPSIYDGLNHRLTRGTNGISVNQWIWVWVRCSGSKSYCRYIPDFNYTLDTLPDLSRWAVQWDIYGTTAIISNYSFFVGFSTGPLIGSVDLKNTIIRNGPNSEDILWQPYTEVSNLQSTSFSGYSIENIASGSTGQVKTVLPEE